MTKTEKLLRDLIALPSVNPAFLPGHQALTGEHRVAGFLADHVGKAGLSVQFGKVLPERSNLIIRLTPAGRSRTDRKRVLVAPHLDTVGAEEVSQTLFTPQKRGSRLHGRGACDTKGSVAAMITALLEVAANGRRPDRTEIVFAGLVDEEDTQAGSRALVKSGFKADLAIVGEPTGLKVVTAHKGDLWLKLETRGKAAHGARPELGKNAVHEMARVVDALETDYARFLTKRTHSLLGKATINVGMIQGGRQPNIVPAHCWIRVDRRTLPGETDARVKKELSEFLKNRGFKIRLTDTKGVPSLPLETDARLPMVRHFIKAAGQSHSTGVDFFSDAGVLGAGGTPTVLFGPGNIAQAHTADEWIQLRQLEQARQILVRFFRDLP